MFRSQGSTFEGSKGFSLRVIMIGLGLGILPLGCRLGLCFL